MTTYKDTDLREALRRKYADTPQLPSDFMNRMQQAPRPKKQRASTPLHYGRLGSLELPPNVAAAPQRGANPHSRRRAGWGWVFSIAAALLIAFLLWPESHEETTTRPEVKPVVAKAGPQSVPQPIVKEKKEEVLAEVQPTPQPVRKQRKAERSEQETIPQPVEKSTRLLEKPAELQRVSVQTEDVLIPADKQALADMYLAEVALQVIYQQREQNEAVRSYAASITGEEVPQPIIAF